MQFGVASRGAHIETVAGFLVAEKMFLEGRREGAEIPERSLWPRKCSAVWILSSYGKNPATSQR
jgi:hypothetical protein